MSKSNVLTDEQIKSTTISAVVILTAEPNGNRMMRSINGEIDVCAQSFDSVWPKYVKRGQRAMRKHERESAKTAKVTVANEELFLDA